MRNLAYLGLILGSALSCGGKTFRALSPTPPVNRAVPLEGQGRQPFFRDGLATVMLTLLTSNLLSQTRDNHALGGHRLHTSSQGQHREKTQRV